MTAGTSQARRRLLDTAADLFYREGVHAVGVDRISAEAGVSKRTLYQQFGGKDQLVAAALEEFGPVILGLYIPDAGDARPPADRMLAVFDALADWSSTPQFRGCPFLNIATELADPGHPAREVARNCKRRLQDYLADQAREAGADQPAVLAEQLVMLFDGAIAAAVQNQTPIPASTRSAAHAVMTAHGLP